MTQQGNQEVTIEQAIAIGLEHHRNNRVTDAENIYRQILQKFPNQPDALHLLGVIAHSNGQMQVAYDLIAKALANIAPPPYFMLSNMARVSAGIGRLGDTAQCLEHMLQIQPNEPDVLNQLGSVYYTLGNMPAAADKWDKATKISPNNSEYFANLCAVLEKLNHNDEAISAGKRALELDPKNVTALANLCFIKQKLSQLEESIEYGRKAIEYDPKMVVAYNSLAIALVKSGDLNEAEVCWNKAVELHPQYGDAHMNIGIVMLLKGDLENGFREYEWRRKSENALSRPRVMDTPQWDGGDLHGKTIFLHAEQGFGDTLNFVRYAKVLKERGGKVIVETQPPLRPLINTVAGIDQIVEPSDNMPKHDLQVAMMTLPLLCKTTTATIPNEVPYISVTETYRNKWKPLVDAKHRPGTLKIGIAWAGSPIHHGDRERSSKLEHFAALSEFADKITFYSLQKGPQAEQIKTTHTGFDVIDLTNDINDFGDTGAFIEQLDLVLSVDTSIVHVAGALGKPVWVMIPFVPDWRWLMTGESSAWYPTMRLFRKGRYDNYIDVLTRIKPELEKLLKD